jgi:hypothetical protein
MTSVSSDRAWHVPAQRIARRAVAAASHGPIRRKRGTAGIPLDARRGLDDGVRVGHGGAAELEDEPHDARVAGGKPVAVHEIPISTHLLRNLTFDGIMSSC